MRLNPYYPGKMAMVRIDRDREAPAPAPPAYSLDIDWGPALPEPRKDLSRGQVYVLGGALQVAPEAMDLPEGARLLAPAARALNHEADSWAYASQAYQASRSDAWTEAPRFDYASHRNAAYDLAQRRAAAAMQAASVRGEPTPWPSPWSPWSATLLVLGGIFATALALTLVILKLMGTI